jgi:membrane protease YdiL (CAAX protease family)
MTGTRIPSRWRSFLAHPASRLGLGFVWLTFMLGLSQVLAGSLKALPELLRAALQVAAMLLAYAAFERVVERRRMPELARTGALPEAVAGVVLGTLLFSAAIGLIALAGGYRVEGPGDWRSIAPMLAMALGAAVGEELLFRGLVFRVAEEWLGSWGALALSSGIFGALHLANPHATLTAALAIALEAGLLLGAAWLVTRRLWLAIGIHAGWNFTQGGVFGVAVSGNEVQGLLRGTLTGPGWLTGGEFGAEASLVAVLVCLAAGVSLLLLARRRGHWAAAPWRHKLSAGVAVAAEPSPK